MTRWLFICFSAWSTLAYGSPNDFYSQWSDGQAEVSGYTLTMPRYGALRQGHAVAIYVTEPFSRKAAVKVDRYDNSNPDHIIALKLNLITKFQTGVYDYSVMTSIFSDPNAQMRPLKQSFSAQEWCGQVYEEVKYDDAGFAVETKSYFEGETDYKRIKAKNAVTADTLWLIGRGLTAGGPGQGLLPTSLFASSSHRRLKHRPVRVYDAGTRWSNTEHNITVPAGSFKVRTLHWQRADDVQCVIQVEVAQPHRVIAWSCDDGTKAKMTGSLRTPYWQRSGIGDEKMLKALGLPVPTYPTDVRPHR